MNELTEKTQIIRELGIRELLLPKLISDALDANNRVKYFFALLQMAKQHADNPQLELSNLRNEREEYSIQDTSFDRVVECSIKKPDRENYYYIPNLNSIVANVIENINQMIIPLQTFIDESDQKGTSDSNIQTNSNAVLIGNFTSLCNRFKDLCARITPTTEENVISGLDIDSITSGEPKNLDSFHLVVMGIHKEINRLQLVIYQESINGAKVYGITDYDRTLIRTFMNGINKTKKLKFDHPGLETTATHSGEELLIQNNIGTTDAHVLVIRVKEMTISVTYSDIHIQRLFFFHSMLDRFQVKWENTSSKQSEKFEGSGLYHLSIGTFVAKNQRDLEIYLSFLASRIVFLIDWNRARKRLSRFVKKKDVFSILKWAADNDLGHIGFLKMGGDQLIFDAVKKTKSTLQFGDELEQVLSSEKAIEFLKFVLKTCAEGLIHGKSEFLIRDEVRVELSKNFRSIDKSLLNIAANHASLIVEISTTVRDGLVQIESDNQEFIKRNAERAKVWEKNADALLNNIRIIVNRSNSYFVFEKLVSNADDAADSMEETLFLLTLVSKEEITGYFYEPLLDLAELATHSSMEYLKAIENAKIIDKWSTREEIDDFLQTVDKIITIEHQADDVHREVKTAIMNDSNNFKQLHILSEISKNIEDVTDSLTKTGVIIRDYVMEVLAS